MKAESRSTARKPNTAAADVTERRKAPRRKADEELRRSEEYFRTLVEKAFDTIVILDGGGAIRYRSPSYKQMLGYAPEGGIGEDLLEHIHPDDVPEVADAFAQMLKMPGGTLYCEVRAQHKDGSWHYVEALGRNLLDNPAVAGIVVNMRDVTDRKQFEQALQESQQHYSALAENLTEAVFKFKGGVIDWCNDRVQAIYGYTKDELLGKDPTFFLPEGTNATEFIKQAYAVMKKDGVFRGATTARRKNGTRVDIEYSISIIPGADPIELVAVARDTTERNLMEKALRESEDRLKRYLESSPDIICVVDLRGIIMYVNCATEKLVGYTREEMVGKRFLDMPLLAPENASKPSEWVYQGGAERPTRPNEFELMKKDGSRVFLEVSTYPMGQGWNKEIIAVGRDVTERKHAEEERARMEQQLLLSGRLAAVGQLAAGVAHELNNPLAAVQAHAQYLASAKDLDGIIRSDIDTIYKEAQRASRITANLLAFARQHEPQRSLISINDVIEATLELHAYRMRVNNIEISSNLDPDLPLTMADFYEMQQVFVNLVVNAEHAMTEAHGKGKLTVTSKKVSQIIQVAFADDGPGISEDNLSRIFDPFFTTKEVGKGTGLGLSIAYGIVEAHGGNLYARSKLGKGTTVVVEIPIVSTDQPAADSRLLSNTR